MADDKTSCQGRNGVEEGGVGVRTERREGWCGGSLALMGDKKKCTQFNDVPFAVAA